MREVIEVATQAKVECIDLTDRVRALVARSGAREGLCQVMVLHSTAAVILNESADPNVGRDLLAALERAIPERAGWLHDRIDDNAAAHIKAALLGPSELLAVEEGELVLGTWQRILLVELDGPRRRQVSVSLLRSA